MSDTFSIDALESEAQTLRTRIAVLSKEMDEKLARLNDIETVVQTLRRLSGDTQPEVVPDPGPWHLKLPAFDLGDRKRVPSPDLVAALVSAVDQPLTREEIRTYFQDAYPAVVDGWSNPVNALNNAIARAVERGNLIELDDGSFVRANDGRRKW